MAAVTSCENALFKYARVVKQKVWNESQNRERDWGETLKIRFFSLASHALQACKARARRARKTLTPRLPISLLILRKKPTVLQSNSTRKYFFMCKYVTRFKFTFSPFAVKVIVSVSVKMAPLTSVISPFYLSRVRILVSPWLLI